MSSPPPNDGRSYRQSRWLEQRRHELPVGDVGDGRKETNSRPSTALDCTRRPSQGQRRCYPDTPLERRNRTQADGSDSDVDMDDAFSEFAAGYYTPRFRTGRQTTMRPSTLEKLNLWFDEYQEQRKAASVTSMSAVKTNSSRGQSAPEYTDEEEDVRKVPAQSPMALKRSETLQEQHPMVANVSEKSPEPKKPVSIVPEANPTVPNRSSTVGLWCLRQLMTALLLLSEVTLKLTIKVFALLRDRLQTALYYLWAQFMAPLIQQDLPNRVQDSKSVVLLIVVAPVTALLAMAYCVVCALYWLNRVLLMETHGP